MLSIRLINRSFLAALFFFGTSVGALAEDDAMTICKTAASNWEAAIASKDANGIANMFTADGIFNSPQGVSKGRDEIQARWGASFKQGGLVKEVIAVREAHRVGDVVYELGDYTLTLATETGSKESTGRYSAVLLKSTGTWRHAMLTAYGLPPPKAQ